MDGDDAVSQNSRLWIVGVLINLVGSLAINLSTNTLKLAHTRNRSAAGDEGSNALPKFFRYVHVYIFMCDCAVPFGF